jgi:16S rRNA C967 or C1407 C5-methylase (RsmB/RsmF family)/NOL1/NOP2/fmu family ribosome biogenesis protein
VNLPQDFLNSLDSIPGLSDPTSLKKSLDDQASVSIRINPSKLKQRPIHLPEVSWSQLGYYLEERPSFTADPWFHAGAYYVQEASSMAVGSVIASLISKHFANQSICILDLCAAPGGKSTDIVSQLRSDDLLVSNEVVKTRAQILKENVIKWGYANHLVTQNDPGDFKNVDGIFDIVVVDAPCSGEGMFRKDHDARSEWSLDHVALCGARQERIVADIWDSLSEGGFLLYSTCTFNTRENEDILDFVKTELGGELYSLDLGDWYHEDRIHRFLPSEIKGEGFSFFVARKTTPQSVAKIKHKVQGIRHDQFRIKRDGVFVQKEDEVFFQTHPKITALMDRFLKLIRPGLHVGTTKKNKWIPSHELALSVDYQNDFPEVALTIDQAHQYLRCDTFPLEVEQKGIHLVKFKGQSIGFLNHLGNRFNNNYPSYWRIRTQVDLNYTSIF